MYRIAKAEADERALLFRRTAIKNGLSEAIVEKDFWVCLTLDYLFNKSKYREHFAFKGGTSLSKAYKLIRRFSEDIDLILDWRVLGYKVNEPWEIRSNTKQDMFCKSANRMAEEFIEEKLLVDMIGFFKKILGVEPNISISEKDKQTVEFSFPQCFEDETILKKIRLEIGPLAAWTPAKNVEITSYIADFLPKAFLQPSTIVMTVAAERTFWEKVTILHREANRINGSFPERYSRHYYDLYCMSLSAVKESAYKNIELLNKVTIFKEKFYRCPWAKYEEIHKGKIRIVPREEYFKVIEEDYIHMQGMIFGNKPSFIEIMDKMHQLEVEMKELVPKTI